MGIFSKTPKPNPKITLEGIEFTFHQEYGGWEFRHRGTDFTSFEPTLTLPSRAELDSILDTIEPNRLHRTPGSCLGWPSDVVEPARSAR